MSPIQRTLKNLFLADQFSLRWITSRRGRPWLDLLMRGFTRAGDWQTWTVIFILGFSLGEPARSIALQIAPRLIATFSLCFLIKRFSKRPRPTQSVEGHATLVKDPDPYSFPSSHTACAWVVCISLGLIMGGPWALWIPYASAISYSRIHVGAHYPLDVMMGAGIGTLIAFLF